MTRRGLPAAPQINVCQRLVVIDCGKNDAPGLYKMINPEIIALSEEQAVLEEVVFQSRIKLRSETASRSIDWVFRRNRRHANING